MNQETKHMIDTPEFSVDAITEVLRDAGFRNVNVRSIVTKTGIIRKDVSVFCYGIMIQKTIVQLKTIFAGQPVNIDGCSNTETITIQPIL